VASKQRIHRRLASPLLSKRLRIRLVVLLRSIAALADHGPALLAAGAAAALLLVAAALVDALDGVEVPDGVVEQGLAGGEQLAEDGVEEDGGDEAEEPVEGVEVLDARGHGERAAARADDALGQAWQEGRHGHEEGHGGPPVDAALVAVAAVGVVQRCGWKVARSVWRPQRLGLPNNEQHTAAIGLSCGGSKDSPGMS
jgi:hypothetical protein